MTSLARPDAAAHILIAEDSATQSQRLQHVLETHGYRVTTAANGRLALDAMRQEKPALVISDVMMPEMDGYELCTHIKNTPSMADVPVILVTTLSDPHDVIRGLECRADNFILKPYDPEQLMRRVDFVRVNSNMRRTEQPGMGLDIMFGGRKHFITADRLQILNLLLSTYEAAIQRNHELSTTRDTLRQTNQELHQLTQDLEDRVRLRTSELEQSNEALRQAQKVLIQQERLRALGQMASGIAHDINNAISPVALYTESLLEREPNLSERARRQLTAIECAINDVAQTVARMREFYRPREQEAELSSVTLNDLVLQVVELTRARWGDLPGRRGVMIDVKTELGARLPFVGGAEHEIRDALTNLIFNAVDAMPTGGTITVRTRVHDAPADDGKTLRSVALEVQDSGTGMDDETRRRCLEPFFTTKGERGTGLGLAMVYGMATRHGARLEIDSERGVGTTIRLLFPVLAGVETNAVAPTDQAASNRALRVLVVDDDAALLESLGNTLRKEGHEIIVANGGAAGIEAFNSAHAANEPFNIVITDLGMPQVDGRRVAENVRAKSPTTPIILLTGWGQAQPANQESVPQVDRVLAKPPRLRELRAALSELAK